MSHLEQLRTMTTVVADTGDALFAASDLTISRHTEFLSAAYYTSMGFAVPASVGVQVATGGFAGPQRGIARKRVLPMRLFL